MTQSLARRCVFFALLTIALTDSAVHAQTRGARQPPVMSRRVQGRDGDIVLVNGEDRITIVRRREGNVRIVFDAVKRSLLLLADYASSTASTPDGLVDWVYSFTDVAGDWPLGVRWEGTAVLDEYWTTEGARKTMVISTADGSIELDTWMPNEVVLLDGAPAFKVTFRGSGTRPGSNGSFDEAERRANDSPVQGGLTTRLGSVAGPDAPVAAVSSPLPQRPGAGQPLKLVDVKPSYPQKARDAGIAGTVVIELTIGTDGAVTDARVLRSIPLLDDAALQAVRQWRYDVNGVRVPVRIIVTVPFGP